LALEQRKIFVPFGFFSFGIDQLTRLVRPERRDTVEELVSFYTRAYVNAMNHISVHDLQKLSGETIGTLPGSTLVKFGGRTVGLLVPLKAADPDRLAVVLAQAEAIAKGRDCAADDAALAPLGEVDPVDWSVEAVRALTAERV
jgi:hypothetical protein